MYTWIRNFLASYRHEGQEHCEPLPDAAAVDLPEYHHPYKIPKQRDVRDVYGICGEHKLDKRWERSNMVLLRDLPGSWNRGKGRMYCHRKMAPALAEALSRCKHYGVLDEIYQMGCFKWRKMKTSASLSMHSWGIALDINPRDGRQKSYKGATAPTPWSEAWYKVWPKGPSENLVRAFEEAGFLWGGRWKRVPDPMHFQLTK